MSRHRNRPQPNRQTGPQQTTTAADAVKTPAAVASLATASSPAKSTWRPSMQTRATGASTERESQGAGQVLLGKGGLGYIARRGVDYGTSMAVQSLDSLARMATQQPLELLSLLPDIVPEVGLAVWNGTFLACGPNALRIKAMTTGANGESEEAPDGTAMIQHLWDNNSDEVGGLIDALGQNYQMLLFSGMCAAEAVPSGRMQGVSDVFPVNSLTLQFRREQDGLLALYQRQTANPNGLGVYSAGFGGFFQPMPMNRFFYARLPGLPDEPYGRAPFAPALSAVLECLAFMRDLLLAFHRVGTPKFDVGFDFEMWATLAKDVVGLTDPLEIDRWVQSKFQDAVNFYNNLNADDAFFHDLKSEVGTVGTGGQWPDITGMWGMLRLRLIQALKQLPTIMGVVEGDTETWSRVQWDIYASSLTTIVSKAAAPLVKASQLHLDLLGTGYTAVPEFAPIRSIARMIDAEAEAIEIANEARKRDEGWSSQETAAMNITGSAPVAEPPFLDDDRDRTDRHRREGMTGLFLLGLLLFYQALFHLTAAQRDRYRQEFTVLRIELQAEKDWTRATIDRINARSEGEDTE